MKEVRILRVLVVSDRMKRSERGLSVGMNFNDSRRVWRAGKEDLLRICVPFSDDHS